MDNTGRIGYAFAHPGVIITSNQHETMVWACI